MVTADHQRSSPDCAGWDRMGIAVYSLQLIVYSLQLIVYSLQLIF